MSKESQARRIETIVRSRRPRAHRHKEVDGRVVFDPAAQPVFTEVDGEPRINHHDVLMFPPSGVLRPGEFYRFPVTKVSSTHAKAGTFTDKPEVMDAYDYAERRVHSIARPDTWGAQRAEARGPAFATLPVKPEPSATSCGVCYLINADHLNFANPWTAEEWNDAPGGADLVAADEVDAKAFEALIAGPRGKVFRVRVSGIDTWQPGDVAVSHARERSRQGAAASTAHCEVECIDLGGQVEVWNQLRNGCVMGRVEYQDPDEPKDDRVIPLVNITTLTPVTPPGRAPKGSGVAAAGQQQEGGAE